MVSVIPAALLTVAMPARATTLQETLTSTYQNNARLQSARAAVDAAQDRVDGAYSGFKPHVNLTASAGKTRIDGQVSPIFGAFSGPGEPGLLPLTLNGSAVGIEIQQPLYRGGRTSAAVNQAQSLVAAKRAVLQGTEQTIFLSAARAYVNVVMDEAVVNLEKHNRNVINQQLESANANFNNGEATRTDVAQSQARLADARARLIQGRGALRKARAHYRRIVGEQPEDLTAPPPLNGLPASLVDARRLAEGNFAVLAARRAMKSAQYQVETNKSRFSPTLSLVGSYRHANDPQFAFAHANRTEIMLRLSVPIYQGGALESQISHDRHLADQRRHKLVAAKRRAIEQATEAWQTYQTASASLKALKERINAARTAFKGVVNEHKVGQRTQLDVLNAQQDLLAAKVALARARGNQRIAAFALKAATGQLTADSILTAGRISPPNP